MEHGFPNDTVVKNLPDKAGNCRDSGPLPELGRSSGLGNGNQSSILAWNSGAWCHKGSDATEHAPAHTYLEHSYGRSKENGAKKTV